MARTDLGAPTLLRGGDVEAARDVAQLGADSWRDRLDRVSQVVQHGPEFTQGHSGEGQPERLGAIRTGSESVRRGHENAFLREHGSHVIRSLVRFQAEPHHV